MWIEAIGYLGAAFTIGTYAAATMIPLRVWGLLSAVAFLIYGILTESVPLIVTEAILIPLNAYRLYEMVKLVRDARNARSGEFSIEWLKPFGTRRRVGGGEILFHKGDEADEMFLIEKGRFRLLESGIELSAGDIVGELGLVAPDNRRTQGLECLEDGRLLCVSYQKLRELYFQNPKFGLFFLQLVSDRLFANMNAGR